MTRVTVGASGPANRSLMQFAPHPDLADVIEYSYSINSAEPQTVAAGPDGTADGDIDSDRTRLL